MRILETIAAVMGRVQRFKGGRAAIIAKSRGEIARSDPQ